MKTLRMIFAWLVIGVILAFIGMRIATHCIGFDANLFSGLYLGSSTLISAVLADPLNIATDNKTVQTTGLICLLLPSFVMIMTGIPFQKDLQSGKEHGNERFASMKEMLGMRDKRVFENNFLWTKHSGLVINAWTKKLKNILQARNFNTVTVGISGLGKTFNISWPEFMAAIGSSLKVRTNKLYCIIEHIFVKLKIETIDELDKKRVKKTKAQSNGFLSKIKNKVSSIRDIAKGFDIFNIDPKGDNLRDTGHMFDKAGFDLRSFNLVDTDESNGYNPFAYIRTRYVNIKDPNQINCSIAAEIGDEHFKTRSDSNLTADEAYTRSGTEYLFSANMEVETRAYKVEDDFEREKKRFDDLPSDIKARLKEIGEDMNPENYGEQVAEVMKDFSYKQSSVRIIASIRNTGWEEKPASIRIKLDNALEAKGYNHTSLNGSVVTYDPDSHSVIWDIGDMEGRAKDVDDLDTLAYELEILCDVKLARVPDGVDLTKTVNCMIKNLGDAEGENQGDEQFWEDTKRLAFMAYVAYLFERYSEEYRNIPEMMKLIDMAKVNGDPSQVSQLDVLMEQWETGYTYLPVDSSERKMRSGKAKGEWVRSDNDAHTKENSMALHCYHAYNSGAPETVQSIIVSCHAALSGMFSSEIKDLLRHDEMELDKLGEPDGKRAIFAVIPDTDKSFGFLYSLMIYQTMNLLCDKAYKKYGGKLPRHVRLILDEFATTGKIPSFANFIAVVRSRNISIHIFIQSFAQLAETYGEKRADIIRDCCSTLLFLGAQTKDSLEMISTMLGEETIYAQTMSKTFNACGFSQSDNANVQSYGRSLMTPAQLRRMEKEKMLMFIYGQHPIFDEKYDPRDHPLYCYIDPTSPRKLTQPVARETQRFDFKAYWGRKRKEKEDETRAA